MGKEAKRRRNSDSLRKARFDRRVHDVVHYADFRFVFITSARGFEIQGRLGLKHEDRQIHGWLVVNAKI